ncbi:probable ATP-dependent RNA helicase DHX37 [Sycon ciliatum]|uniref:probable ATP-dependent RNA helicase DHX37 n=1 Tax=Sycon ciliatum TaxID=27933 RepID=UPI0031F6E351
MADIDDVGYSQSGSSGGKQRHLSQKQQKRQQKLADKGKKKTGLDGSRKQKLSQKQRRRGAKLLEEKEKKSKRSALLESLEKHRITANEMQLLQPTSKLGITTAVTNVDQLTSSSPTPPAKPLGRKRKRNLNKKRTKKSYGYALPVSSSDDDESEEDLDSPSSTSEDEHSECESDRTESKTTSPSKPDETECMSKSLSKSDKAEGLCESPVKPSKPDEAECTSKSPSKMTSAPPSSSSVKSQPSVYVPIQRDPAIQAARLKLPILGEEQVIMEAINENQIVIIAGETGSGKTTQVPQFLYEAGYTRARNGRKACRIGVTEPRRVAAVSMARRVAEEMSLTDKEVSYQIRYEGTVTDDTEIKFMTDGVLLKEIENDFLLTNYSAVIVDEAHERSVYTDILLGLLSRIVPLRTKRGNPLKLIIMSATLRVEDFTENRHLFPTPPPVIKVGSRQFPVTVHFTKRTPNDDQYMQEAVKKVCKIHRELPEGGILVFVTGQQEINWMCSSLRRTFPAASKASSSAGNPLQPETQRRRINLDDVPCEPTFDSHDVDGEIGDEGFENNQDSDDSDGGSSSACSDNEDDDFMAIERRAHDQSLPMKVLPLYALLAPERQAQVFAPPPDGVRLCVVATNVAETSLTIPNVKYIVDTGKVKRRYFDNVTGVSTFRVGWTSAASANQRAGRAGRTGPGHCYRLFSSAVYGNEFEKFSPPEIIHRPVDDLYLQLKNMHIVKVENFPFPTPPPADSIKAAEQLLISLGALELKKLQDGKGVASGITPMGQCMAAYPVSPRFSKMLTVRDRKGVLPYVIAMVAILSVQDILVMPSPGSKDEEEDKEREKSREQFAKALVSKWGSPSTLGLLGDVLVLMKAVLAAEAAGCSNEFCEANGIRRKAVLEVRKLRKQLSTIISSRRVSNAVVLDPNLPPPSALQVKFLRQLMLSGLCDHVARKIDTSDMPLTDKKRLRYAYQSCIMEEPVYMNSACALKYQKMLPEFVVFREVVETTKSFMQCVVAVDGDWLPIYAAHHCQLSEPLEMPEPTFDANSGQVHCHRTATFGPYSWPIAAQALAMPDGQQKYMWFAKFLLDGLVVKALAKFSGALMYKPSTILRPWGYRCHVWIKNLLDALVTAGACDRASIINIWKSKPKFLLAEYKAWLPQSQHASLHMEWPPLSKAADTDVH